MKSHSNPREDERSGGNVDVSFSVPFVHRVRFTQDVFATANTTLLDAIAAGGSRPAKLLVFVDGAPELSSPNAVAKIQAYARAHSDRLKLAGPVHVVPGGEQCKNRPDVLESCLRAIEEAGLCRQSFVVAVGGGAVLDVVSYAAAIAHRGIRLIRVPTTTLSQSDSGVGVKSGVNAYGKKNYLGTFGVPWAVINDTGFLDSLSQRDWRCGFSEAVKVALLKDRRLFEQILHNKAAIRRRETAVAVPILARSAELHLRHITEGGDPFEMTTARPLDFGHWSAHKLERMTDFHLRHGEAVAIGLALDVVYAATIGLLDWSSAESVLDCLEGLGFALHDEAMRDTDGLLEGIEEFREHLGGRLTITLITGIGRPVNVHEIRATEIRTALAYLADRSTSGGVAPWHERKLPAVCPRPTSSMPSSSSTGQS